MEDAGCSVEGDRKAIAKAEVASVGMLSAGEFAEAGDGCDTFGDEDGDAMERLESHTALLEFCGASEISRMDGGGSLYESMEGGAAGV